MKIIAKQNTVITSGDFGQEVSCGISAKNMKYVARLLRDNYSDTPWASVREINANAVDACKKANGGSGRLPTVHVPNRFDFTFSVRDYGKGLTPVEMLGDPDDPTQIGLYASYGESTKRGSDDDIGGFGIGRFAPLSYSDSFTVESFVDGVRYIYAVRINEYDDTKITPMGQEKTDEPNGVLISMPVKAHDADRFQQMIKRLSFFGLKIDTTVEMPDWDKEAPISLQDKNWEIRDLKNVIGRHLGYSHNEHSWHYTPKHYVVMGGIPYPLDPAPLGGEEGQFLSHLNRSLILRLPTTSSVKLHHSREMLEYRDFTKDTLRKAINEVRKDLEAKMQKEIDKCNDIYDAVKKYQDFNTFTSNRSFVNLTWNGRKILTSWSLRELGNDIARNGITEMWKFVVSSTNVNGTSCRKGYSCQADFDRDAAILYDDLPLDTKGKNLIRKVKYLLEEDNFKVVYVIRFTDAQHEHLRPKLEARMKEQHFDEIIKCGKFFRLSQAKEKALPKRPKSQGGKGKKAFSLMGISIHTGSYRNLHGSWNRNISYGDLPSGTKYYVVTDNSYIKGYAGAVIYPFHSYNGGFRAPAVRSFLGLKDDTPIFGVTVHASKRIKKENDWVNLADLIKKKAEAYIKKHPEVLNTSSDEISIEKNKNSLLQKFFHHPELNESIRGQFKPLLDKLDVIRTQQETASDRRETLELACRSLGYDPELEKVVRGKQDESAKLFGLVRTYLPFYVFRNSGYYNQDDNQRLVNFINDCNLGSKKIDRAVEIANAIEIAKKVSKSA